AFRGRSYDPQSFKPTGSNPARAMRADVQGLRITMPPEHNSKLPVGFVPHFGVRGDFEITLSFEILRIDKPASGTGAGVSIWIRTTSATDEAATIGRAVRSGGEQVFFSHRASTPIEKKREHHSGKPLATECRTGKLRLTRNGPMLSYLVAEGDGNEFRELYQ